MTIYDVGREISKIDRIARENQEMQIELARLEARIEAAENMMKRLKNMTTLDDYYAGGPNPPKKALNMHYIDGRHMQDLEDALNSLRRMDEHDETTIAMTVRQIAGWMGGVNEKHYAEAFANLHDYLDEWADERDC